MHQDPNEQRLAPYFRHAERFGPEFVFETAEAAWTSEVVSSHRELRKRLPRPRDITWMAQAELDLLLDEREVAFAGYHAEFDRLLAEVRTSLVRLRVEIDMIEARGPRWQRNAHRPTSTVELKRAVATLAADGLPSVEIARALNLRVGPPPTTGGGDDRPFDVSRVDSLRVRNRTMGKRRRRRTAEETATAVAALWAERLTTGEIGGKLGISPKRVQQVIHDQGLLRTAGGGITPSGAGVFRPRMSKPEEQHG